MEALGTWPLTGRDEELSILVGLIEGRDRGAGVVIAGRPGVGKTRLVREAVAAASRQGWAVRWVVGTAAARAIPLGPFAEWAARFDANPLQLVRSVIAALTASADGAAVLVAVDDAHLLDDLSAFVLYQLIRRRAATVIATLRSGERAPDAVTALWKGAHLRRLDLQPLSRSQAEALLEGVLGGHVDAPCADRMWRLTAGNALFLRQVVTQELDAQRLLPTPDGWRWTGPMSVSESLVDLIDTQIGAVPDAVGDVIDLVAVAEPLELVYLRRLAGPGAVEDCERRGLITLSAGPDDGVARVAHPLYGEARVAQSGRLRLARLRGRIASAMTQSGAAHAAADPVRLGQLWLESDLAPDPGIFSAGAQGAYARLDIELAAQLAEAAVAAGAGPDTQLLLAHALSLSSSPEIAQEMLDGLAAGELPDPLRSVVMQLRGANLLWPLAQPEAAWAVIDDTLADPSPTTATEALAFRALQLATAARPHETLATSARIDRDRLGALPALMLAWAMTIALGDLGQPQQAAAVAQDAVTAAAASPAAAVQTPGVILCEVQALVLGGNIAHAQTVAENAYRQLVDVLGVLRTFAAAISGVALVAAGDVAAALRRLGPEAVSPEMVAGRTGLPYYLLIIYLETVCYTGDFAASTQALDLMERNRHPAYAFLEPRAQLAKAWVSATGGRLWEARAGAVKAADCARDNGQHAWEVRCRQAAIQFGDTGQASRLAELVTKVDGPRGAVVARWAQAVARQDAHTLSTVSSDLEAIGDRIAAADAAAQAAIAFRHNQQRGPALTATARASRLIGECGASTPATRTAATPLPLLTGREREISELVAAGMSNKQIAEAMELSVRTVEGHIYRCCTKLGLTHRTELAALMSHLTAPDN
jgi:DNA-binding CsgD family transcriptional regulator